MDVSSTTVTSVGRPESVVGSFTLVMSTLTDPSGSLPAPSWAVSVIVAALSPTTSVAPVYWIAEGVLRNASISEARPVRTKVFVPLPLTVTKAPEVAVIVPVSAASVRAKDALPSTSPSVTAERSRSVDVSSTAVASEGRPESVVRSLLPRMMLSTTVNSPLLETPPLNCAVFPVSVLLAIKMLLPV